MKILLTTLLTTSTLSVFSQKSASLKIPSNSFEEYYLKSNPTLTYSYDSISQTHNYSNNWDFDKDGTKDELYFVGTGGAHLYFYLKVVLSIDSKPREFNFVESDFPELTAIDTLNFNKAPVGFVVTDLGKNKIPAIIVRLDDQIFYTNKQLKNRKIKTPNIVISFENGKTKFGSL